MPEALGAVADFAFDLGRRPLLWECIPGNLASASVARKAGFTYLGEGASLYPDRAGAKRGGVARNSGAGRLSRSQAGMADAMISVVLFDLDDTLFAHRRAVEDGVVAHLRTTGLLDSGLDGAEEARRWSALEERHYTRYLEGELDYLGQRRARATDFLEPYGVTFETDGDAELWFETYLHQYRAAWQLHDDAIPALRALDALSPRASSPTE